MMTQDSAGALRAGKDNTVWAVSRVLIVDDHPFYSDGLASMLTREYLAHEVDHAASVAQALTRLCDGEDYDLILLDLTLPDEDGLSLLPRMDKLGLLIPVVVISSHDDETTIRFAQASGVQGFMPKSAGRNALVQMVRGVEAGETFFPLAGGGHVAEGGSQQPEREAIRLTPRQADVLRLLAQGYPNKRICQQLDLTEHTVKTHLKAVFQTLDVHNRTECVTLARSLGLLCGSPD